LKKRDYQARLAQREAARAAALAGFRDFRDKLPVARKLEEQLLLRQLHDAGSPAPGNGVIENLSSTKKLLDLYQVMDNPHWQDLPQVLDLPLNEGDRLRQEVADLLYWLANAYRFNLVPPGKDKDSSLARAWDFNQRAEACYVFQPVPPAILVQKAKLAEKLGKKEAKEILAQAQKMPLKTGWDYYAAAFELAANRKVEEAVVQLNKSVAMDPKHFSSQLLLAVCRHNLASLRTVASQIGRSGGRLLDLHRPQTYIHPGLPGTRADLSE
jgi:hypothetical protein